MNRVKEQKLWISGYYFQKISEVTQMDKLIIASTRSNAGKTSVIIGMTKSLGKEFGYLKPFGDRLFYRKKRLWDYDAALMANIFNLEENPEDMSMGFEHSKVRYMYDQESTKQKLLEMISDMGEQKEQIFIEGGHNLSYGTSVNLDSISLTKHVDGKLVIVLSGDEGMVMDDISFITRYVDHTNTDFRGVIINKVSDIDDFKSTYLDDIHKMGVNVIGIIPHIPQLTYISVHTLLERLFVKVIAGEGGLNNVTKNIFIGVTSADAVHFDPLFKREGKLVITSGDRSDMIVTALEHDTSCIILTNNIVPAANILARASEANIPLLLVPEDTYQVVRQIDGMDNIISKNETDKINKLQKLAEDHIDMGKI
jgi:BioD-like phosphotransacetylase family protein